MKRSRHLAIFLMLSLLLVGNGHAQLNVMSSSFSAYNVTPNSISQVSISSSNSGMVYIESQLTNSANEVVLRVKSEPVQIVIGLNVFGAHNTQFQSTAFSNSPQAKFIQTQHRLPSGVFNHCIRIIPISGIEDGDEYCNQINAEEDGFLYLINPMDQDTIDTFNPLLLWAHSEPFNLLNQGEFFKMTLVELQSDQSAQDGIIKNQPVFLKTYLSRHEVPYPFDAKKLMPGKRYGWQVQKISNGAIINQTEAWEFVLVENEIPEDHMYVKLLKKLDGGHYKVQNDRIFFRFDERYKSDHLVCRIYTDASVLIEPELLNKQKQEIGAKVTGYNNYELDVQPYHLKTGFYLLEVENEKGDKYLLKFYVG